MHTVVIKRDVHARHPWVARSLYKAFDTALDDALAALHETTALKVALPWVVSHAEEVNQLMGERPWAYGVEPNRHVLEAFLRYSNAQGLAREVRSVDSLFVPELFDAFAI